LNSSLAQSAAKLWLAKVWSEMVIVTLCVFFKFLSEIRFLTHNFGYRHARKPIKGSNGADFSLVFKNVLSQKIAGWVGAQGLIKLAKI